jgi:predicted RNase H-like HicB family nuclease
MGRELRTYTFTAVVEAADEMWHAYCPTLLAYGAATWGATREEVLGHIRDMAAMIVERLAEEGASVPVASAADQEPMNGERIVVTVCVPLGDAPHPAV